MDYLFSEDQLMIKDLVRQIAEDKVVPVRAELDEKEEFPWEIMKVLAQSDLFGLFVPEEYGSLLKSCQERVWVFLRHTPRTPSAHIRFFSSAPTIRKRNICPK
jgi:alkylation response protein AidB-like acyl-CoA dehydrogenase